MAASILDIAEDTSIWAARPTTGEAVAYLRESSGIEAWVLDDHGSWPAYLEGVQPAASDREERLRWAGLGQVNNRVTFRFAQGLSLYECEVDAFPTDDVSFETRLPETVSHCRARCEARLPVPVGTRVELPNGNERPVLNISNGGLRFAVGLLTDVLQEGDVVPLVLRSPGIAPLSLRVDVRHLSELVDDGPLTAGGCVELDYPAAEAVWSRFAQSTDQTLTTDQNSAS